MHVGRKIFALWPLLRGVVPAIVFALAMALACGDDDSDNGGMTRRDGGPLLTPDAADDSVVSPCPSSVPRIGENCTEVKEANTRCSFVIDVCSYNGSSYDKTVDFCCSPGSNWDQCGTGETPCDRAGAEADAM
jgi:hypothetical protein